MKLILAQDTKANWYVFSGFKGGSYHILFIKNNFSVLEYLTIGKNTRLFRYDLNKIPYDFTVEVTNRFKGLDDRQSAWRIMDRGSRHCTGGSDKDHPQEKEMQKGKNGCLRRPYK